MVDEILKKSKNSTLLISQLIQNFNHYSTQLHEKWKIQSMFSEMDNYLRNDLNTLVKLSNERYKSVKSGNKIDKIINKQLGRINVLANEVNNSELYRSEKVYEEKKKLDKLQTKNTEILNIRNNLRDIKRNEGTSQFNHVENVEKNVIEFIMKSDLDYLNILDNEKNSICANINNYIGQLIELRKSPHLMEEFNKLKFSLNAESLQFFKYRDIQNSPVTFKTIKASKIDLQKIMKLNKSIKNFKQAEIDAKGVKRSLSVLPKVVLEEEKVKEPPKEFNATELFANTMIHKNNPISIIKSGVGKSYFLESNLKTRENEILNTIGDLNLPKLEDYQRVIAKKINAKKLSKMINSKEKEDKGFQDKFKDKKDKKIVKENQNFLAEINNIKRKAQTYIDDYSKRENLNNQLDKLNKFIYEKGLDKKKLNRKIDEFLIRQEKALQEKQINNQINLEKLIAKKSTEGEEFRQRFINNLNDPSFNLEDNEDEVILETSERPSKIIYEITQDKVNENYTYFKNLKEELMNKQDIKPITKDVQQQEELPQIKTEFSLKTSDKFKRFSEFIITKSSKEIIEVIKETGEIDKNMNLFDRHSNVDLPLIDESYKLSPSKNRLYNLNLITRQNDSADLLDKI